MNIRLNSMSSDAPVALRVSVARRELAVVSVVPLGPVAVHFAVREQDEQEKRVIGSSSQCVFPRDGRALC